MIELQTMGIAAQRTGSTSVRRKLADPGATVDYIIQNCF